MLAIGLMSGTSLDGVDAALIETDGEDVAHPVAFLTAPFGSEERAVIGHAVRDALAKERPGETDAILAASRLVTDRHAQLVEALLEKASLGAPAIGVAGFHGQTVAHRPERGWTWQIGDGAALAERTGISVVAPPR